MTGPWRPPSSWVPCRSISHTVRSWVVAFLPLRCKATAATWVALAAGVARLGDLTKDAGDEDTQSMREWVRRLVAAVQNITRSFDKADDDDSRDFRMRAYHTAGEHGSGGRVTLSGWLTALAWWRADGRRQEAYTDADLAEHVASKQRLATAYAGGRWIARYKSGRASLRRY